MQSPDELRRVNEMRRHRIFELSAASLRSNASLDLDEGLGPPGR